MIKGLPNDFAGLFGEVVTYDVYRLRRLPFKPDLIFDIGANVGFFTRYARELFPSALIVAVEPNPGNFNYLKQHSFHPRTVFLNQALGTGGTLYHGTTARNGSGETYLSVGLGYPGEMMDAAVRKRMGLEFCPKIQSVTLADLFVDYHRSDLRCMVKIDCEGAENFIWQDACSFYALQCADYIAMELHDYGLTQITRQEVLNVTEASIELLRRTHACERQGVNFWALKYEYANQISK